MPHFPVIKLDRQTSKVRIVFDASSRYLGLSLNDCTNQGPNLQQDIVKILTMWLLEFNIETHLWQAGTKARLDGGGENKMTFFILQVPINFIRGMFIV